MDPFSVSISKLIEEEVERRVNDRITSLLQYMADEYKMPLKHLVRIMQKENLKVTQCVATAKNGKRCKNRPQENGYCTIHQGACPKKKFKSPEVVTKHTHTLPPLFVAGCPACEKGKPLRDLADCFSNDKV